MLGLVALLAASPALACDSLTWATPRCGSVEVWSNCDTRYQDVYRAPRVDGELVLHLHWGISATCEKQAQDRWACFALRCFGIGLGKTCPAISSACWRQIN